MPLTHHLQRRIRPKVAEQPVDEATTLHYKPYRKCRSSLNCYECPQELASPGLLIRYKSSMFDVRSS